MKANFWPGKLGLLLKSMMMIVSRREEKEESKMSRMFCMQVRGKVGKMAGSSGGMRVVVQYSHGLTGFVAEAGLVREYKEIPGWGGTRMVQHCFAPGVQILIQVPHMVVYIDED